jgi:hypothetical protein
MSAREEFHEIQQFRQWWFWTLMVLIATGMIGVNVIAFYHQIVKNEAFGDKPTSDTGLILVIILSTAIMIAMLVIFYHAKMEVRIERYGISYRYFPFIRSWRFIDKDAIKTWKIKSYLPSGYGIRLGLKFKTLNVSGRTGLELILNERRNIRLGTRRPEEMQLAMEKLFNRKEE